MSGAKSRSNANLPVQSDRDAREDARRSEARAQQRARDELLLSEHERIAAELAAAKLGDPELARAREQVGKWRRDHTCSDWYVHRWTEILSGPPTAVAQRLRALEAGERMALVQNTPFGFLLAEQVRG
ncbi:MAG: hypothetical protein AB1452_18030 [Pseudomonadota bacterium]